MRIDFIIAGNQKCGTTALYEHLKTHPSIYIPKKEIHYFDNEDLYSNDTNYNKYHSFFSEHNNQKILGEATPIYLYWHGALERIKQYSKDIKIIVILRNPIERAFSHWNMEHNRGNEHLTFSEAIQHEASRCAEALPQQHRIYSYIDRGHYINQLSRLWSIIPKEQTLIINSANLKNRQLDTLLKVYDFLNIEIAANPPPIISHQGVYTQSITDSERAYLKDIYSAEIKELEAALNWDCSDWLA